MKQNKGIQMTIDALRAGYSFYYLQSWEQNSHAEQLQEAVEAFELNGVKPFNTWAWQLEGIQEDPGELLDMLDKLDVGTICIARNYHWFIKDNMGDINKEVVQKVLNRADTYSSNSSRKALIIIGSESFDNAIPEVLQKDFMQITLELPGEEEIGEILARIVETASKNERFSKPSVEALELIVQNSKSLTRREINNAYAYSIIKDGGHLLPETVADIQAKEVASTKGLSIGKYDVAEPQGLQEVKKFVQLTLMSKIGREMAMGILLLGPPGTGKTHFAKWVGTICGLKVIVAELAQIFGSLVGETEQNMGRFIEVVTANSPCVLLIDEIEKGLAGMGKSGTGSGGDGGVTKRAMGQFLKFLSDDRPEGVYVIATCNDIQSLPPEWVRAERWDTSPFFIDLPNDEEKEAILTYYQGVYSVEGRPTNMDGWSGAEIKAVCRIAAMMERDVPEAERFVIPVAETMAEDIKSLRSWALTPDGKRKRCIPASTPVNGVKKKRGERAIAL